VEGTESQGKELVSIMKKLVDMEDRKVAAAREIAEKQLQYFKLWDSEIAATQRGLVQAVNGLSSAIVAACTSQGGKMQRRRPAFLDCSHAVPDSRPPRNFSAHGGGATATAPEDQYDNLNGDIMKAANENIESVVNMPHCPTLFRDDNTPVEDSQGHVNIAGEDLLLDSGPPT
jgi:hypothetical protein